MDIVFGPVPSRRLGRSLGINNVPPKECTYACVYCQLGNTLKLEIDRRKFYSTEKIASVVESRLKTLTKSTEKVDYLTFVPDGEPTLDLSLEEEIQTLKKFGIKIAVITNSSLMNNEQVRAALYQADWVSVKVDTVNEQIWHKIDRPHKRINFSSMLNGIKIFANYFNHFLATETMLVHNVNDSENDMGNVASFISKLKPDKSYISIPTRPPAELHVMSPDSKILNTAYQIFSSNGISTELITGYEGNEFSATGNLEEDILNITSVHPMREDAVQKLVIKNSSNWEVINSLINSGVLTKSGFNGKTYYLRNLKLWRNERK